MKQVFTSAVRSVVSDRPLLALIFAMMAGGIVYILYVAFNLSASELQLAVRYTSYGETQFYRDQWWYLLSFVGFGIMFIAAHIGITAKLVVIEQRQLAYAFAWLSLVVLVLMFAYTYSVLGIAYLQ